MLRRPAIAGPVRVRAPSRFDIALGSVLALVVQLEYHIDYADSADVTPRHVLVGLLLSLPLIWRRVAPAPVGLGVVTVFSLQPEILSPTPNTAGAALCLVVAVGALALYPQSWLTAIGSAAAATSLGVLGAWLDPDPKGIEGVSMSLTILGVWGAGALLRRQTERARRSEAAIVSERISAQMRARDLVAEERGRIARELHDVVSHGMGVVVLQARGGRRVLDADVGRARLAFDEIERVSADCLREMRLMLDVLRIEEEHDATDPPQPGLGCLEDLLGEMRAAGLVIEAEIVGERVELPTGLDLSAYRIVQEALTNVARHAPGAPAVVTVTYADDSLTLEVVDEGPPVPPPEPGHGLVGMRERVELYDGELSWGPSASGGFHVRATLPYATATP
jgi:signal transduction histidine kinase